CLPFLQDVEALFRSESCPPVIGCEFAHNNNWYITFQSDSDAQQAFRYLREEVKTFQGKPILARIKAKPIAINTFFPKNGYRVLDSNLYPQQPQSQQQYASPLFMQPVYSPQQQYPLYSLLPQTWSPSQPYFETPLAPFPNSPFVNGFSSAGAYKSSSSPQCILRPDYRNR
ncbi:la-related protein 4-like, partial [Cetorhinus maximus]